MLTRRMELEAINGTGRAFPLFKSKQRKRFVEEKKYPKLPLEYFKIIACVTAL